MPKRGGAAPAQKDIRGFFSKQPRAEARAAPSGEGPGAGGRTPALGADELALVAGHATCDCVRVLLCIDRAWAAAALGRVDARSLGSLVDGAVAGDRDKLRCVNDIATRGRQLGVGRLEALLDEAADCFIYANQTLAVSALRACSTLRAAVARRACASLHFRHAIDEWLVHEVVCTDVGPNVDLLAQRFMEDAVTNHHWNVATKLLRTPAAATGASGGDAWKRALYATMRAEHGTHGSLELCKPRHFP
jgi:hypothetical protein